MDLEFLKTVSIASVRARASGIVREGMVSTSRLQWVRLSSFDDRQDSQAPSVVGRARYGRGLPGGLILPESVTTHPR
jgi:hypothetical protein